MSNVAVSVEGLGKAYSIQGAPDASAPRPSLVHRIAARAGLRLAGGPHTRPFWALRDINIEIKQGERVGIIGRNGAGKSTLLKILSRVTQPTEGRARLRGRVSSLLEVGVGFHPELSGRDNVYLNAAILGLKRVEIDRVFDAIVDYSGVGAFIDSPLKHYSSGMQVRLAFAVVSHLDPEIVIVDEVLAVGDATFQRKSIGRMQEVADEGRTVLFVSHSMASVRTLCSRGIYIDGGRIVADGPVAEVIEKYIGSTIDNSSSEALFPDNPKKNAVIRRAAVVGRSGQPRARFGLDEEIVIEIDYILKERIRDGMAIAAVSRDGNILFQTHDTDKNDALLLGREPGYYRARFPIPRRLFTAGTYSVYPTFAVGLSGEYGHDGHANAVSYVVDEHDQDTIVDTKGWAPMRSNLLIVEPVWDTERMGPGEFGWAPDAVGNHTKNNG